jgi:hypothetical protein
MERYWSDSGRVYGELSMDNILCDLSGKSISFVDPGRPEKVYACEQVSRHWYPASRDLAYMLYDAGASVRTTLGKPAARRCHHRLVERVLRAFLQRVGPADQKRRLLEEIRACVRVHLQSLRGSFSPRGIWHWFLRRIAARRIESILGRLAEPACGGRGRQT